jgi:plasmid stability protein
MSGILPVKTAFWRILIPHYVVTATQESEIMALSLTVRNLDEDLVRRLKMRAARNNRSIEAEHREILHQALDNEQQETFKAVAARLRVATAGRSHTPAETILRRERGKS